MIPTVTCVHSRAPTETRAHESSATKHQTTASEQHEQRQIATEITPDQMFVQEKFHPLVISSNWCFGRHQEVVKGSFRQEKPSAPQPSGDSDTAQSTR